MKVCSMFSLYLPISGVSARHLIEFEIWNGMIAESILPDSLASYEMYD